MHWFIMKSNTLVPVENPIFSDWCGNDHIKVIRIIHVAANPAYKPHRFRIAMTNDPAQNVRSYNRITTGAVAITSLVAIPRAQHSTEIIDQVARRDWMPRIVEYSVSR